LIREKTFTPPKWSRFRIMPARFLMRKLYGDHSLWVRPLTMFQEQVEVNGRLVPRFTPLDE
jgi:hypothetical protein